ncbi:sodium:solute symporter family protein [Methanoculleus sp.]|uniref:sodium:solute symporter family protein n=1 Tax=Methanoculleus sp. TaxID=90427 RepID=UPI002FC6DFC7
MTLELLIILLYLASMLAIGFIVQRRGGVETSKGYLVANRNVGPLLIGGTLFATFWGGGTLLGGSGAAYGGHLLATIADPWASGITLLLMAAFFVTILRQMKIASLSEMYYLRYGARGAYLASFLSVPTLIFWTSVQILAISKILTVLVGLPGNESAFVAGLIVITYTYLGGMLAVIITDNIQMVLILLGLVVLIPTGVAYAGGMDVIAANTPTDFWSMLPSNNSPSGLGWTVTGVMAWLAAWCGMGLGSLASLDISQRVFCVRDDRTARRGLFLGAILYWVAGIGPIFIGLLGIVMVSTGLIDGAILAEDPELLVPFLAKTLLPPWMMAIFIASLMAAIMSTASSAIFAAAAAISTVFLRGSVSDGVTDNKAVLRLTRSLVVGIGLFSIGISFVAPGLYDLMIFGFTLLFACLFWALVCGLFWKRANAPGAIASMAGGFLTTIAGAVILSVQRGTLTLVPPDNEWTIFFTFGPTLVSGSAMYVVSMLTQKTHPPVPLKDTDGAVLKWPELETTGVVTERGYPVAVAPAAAGEEE